VAVAFNDVAAGRGLLKVQRLDSSGPEAAAAADGGGAAAAAAAAQSAVHRFPPGRTVQQMLFGPTSALVTVDSAGVVCSWAADCLLAPLSIYHTQAHLTVCYFHGFGSAAAAAAAAAAIPTGAGGGGGGEGEGEEAPFAGFVGSGERETTWEQHALLPLPNGDTAAVGVCNRTVAALMVLGAPADALADGEHDISSVLRLDSASSWWLPPLSTVDRMAAAAARCSPAVPFSTVVQGWVSSNARWLVTVDHVRSRLVAFDFLPAPTPKSTPMSDRIPSPAVLAAVGAKVDAEGVGGGDDDGRDRASSHAARMTPVAVVT
jgi:hypothetical protein